MFADISDLVATSIRKIVDQGGPSAVYTRAGQRYEVLCKYRHPDNGRACAVGVVMDNSVYESGMEGTRYRNFVEETRREIFDCDGRNYSADAILQDLQHAHDKAADKQGRLATDEEFFPIWREYLAATLKEFDLWGDENIRAQFDRIPQ